MNWRRKSTSIKSLTTKTGSCLPGCRVWKGNRKQAKCGICGRTQAWIWKIHSSFQLKIDKKGILIKFMYSKVQYNIISGEKKPYNSIAKSSSEISSLHKQRYERVYRLPALGTAKDHKSFRYAYGEDSRYKKTTSSHRGMYHKLINETALNYTNQGYDFINHCEVNPIAAKIPHEAFNNRILKANKKGILTRHIDEGRLLAPNYHMDF